MKLVSSFTFLILLCMASVTLCKAQNHPDEIWHTKEYKLFKDSIVQQNKYVAKALSATEIISNYQSPANEFQSPALSFKFSINGKDNEMKPGMDHHFNCIASTNQTPLIEFGSPMPDTNGNAATYLLPDSKLTIRLDFRKVLSEFKTKGYYTTFNGDKIFREDFKGVYVAGGTAPMIWDFDNLVNHPELQLKDGDGDGIYETTLILNARKDEKQTAASWKLSKNISAFPQYKSPYPISDALYNMSLEEMINAVEPDSTFRTGKEWAGVWTRDISYSIILSMAHLQPAVAMNSLMRKVNKRKRIIQDTGTGGAYPASTDRMIWAVAAWEVYKATGNKDWLQQAFLIIKNSIDDDLQNAYDNETGLVRGESSFLDWREQTYPKWMQPADIYSSENLGTNAVHYQANMVLSAMAKILKNQPVYLKHQAIAAKIKAGVNKFLWMKDKGYYAQYLYGRNYAIVSPRSEALGEALCILFNIADEKQKQSIIENTPVIDFGIPCIYPQIPNIPPYHNNAVWPFVQSFWAMASRKTANEKSVMESIGAIYRPAAMFVTNKENFVATNGDFAGTQINSSNMLWSLSGSLGLIHTIIFGMDFQPDKLLFHPFVPLPLKGTRTLTNFTYRNAILNITLEGHGNQINGFYLDEKKITKAEIPAGMKGRHAIKIILANDGLAAGKINKSGNHVTLISPSVAYQSNALTWQKVEGAISYIVLKNGKVFLKTTATTMNLKENGYAEYQLIAVDSKGAGSFASEPLVVANPQNIQKYELENNTLPSTLKYKGYSGKGFVEIDKKVNTIITIPVIINESGRYAVDIRYANGNGPTNTSNKCAIRTLKKDNSIIGTFVFPQRGNDEWSNWGFSNSIQLNLSKGINNLTISFEPWNENMNELVNQAMLDYIRVIKLK